jgi:hypothetical protein
MGFQVRKLIFIFQLQVVIQIFKNNKKKCTLKSMPTLSFASNPAVVYWFSHYFNIGLNGH